jgi:hypothetical protein
VALPRLKLAAALALLLAVPARSATDDVWRERFVLWPTFAHYGLTYYGQRFMLTVRMLESGETHRFGYENPDWDRDLCPCLGRDQRESARATLAFLRCAQAFILSDPERRREFMKAFADYYHANGPAANAEYAKELRDVWKRAGNWMKAHGLDQTQSSCLHPFEGVGWGGTKWTP